MKRFILVTLAICFIGIMVLPVYAQTSTTPYDYQDMRLDANKNNILINRKEIKKVDKKHTKWNKHQDKKINKNRKQIKRVDKKHTRWNRKQDKTLAEHNNRIANNSARLDNHENRINNLESTQYIVGGAIRIIDSQKWNVELFADYSTNRQMVDRTGIKFVYKFGTSYTDKKIAELEQRLNNLK